MALWGLRGTKEKEGKKGRAETRPGAKMVLGRRAWLDCLSLPTHAPETAGVSWVSRLKVPGASPGLCPFLWKVVLEESSWSSGGSGWGIVHGGGYVTVTNTVLISKATVLAPAWRRAPLGQSGGALVPTGLFQGVPQGQCLSSCLWALSCWWMPFAEPELVMAGHLSGQLLIASMSFSTC